jgi:phosphate starvation-inducible PhoH-like protein
LDAHLRDIEAALGVTISRRGEQFSVEGARATATRTLDLLGSLHAQAVQPISAQTLQLALTEARAGLAAPGLPEPEPPTADAGTDHKPATRRRRAAAGAVSDPSSEAAPAAVAPEPQTAVPGATEVVLRTRRSDLRGRTPNQVRYLQQILASDISFGIGPAGTGKTFLAVACAVDALERQGVQRIVLTRPAVEAGERLGFLPGDLAQKVDPYLRPLYDALYDLMGFDRVTRAFERGQLEIAPLAFMRGRTLNHAFVILDEAQNTTREQMKMFLTRIGFGSKCVVTGDVSQIDLPGGVPSGLVDAAHVLAEVKGIAFTHFTAVDVVRHPLVARIVEAYDADRQGLTPGAAVATAASASDLSGRPARARTTRGAAR